MIGVFALAGWPPSELAVHTHNLAAEMATKPSWEISTSVTGGLGCGRIGPKRANAVWTSPDSSCKAWLDGFASTLDASGSQADRAAGADVLAKALLLRGPQALLDFQGEFFLLVLDQAKRTLLTATDRFGTRTTYRHSTSGRLAICSELRPLLSLSLIPRKLDKPFVTALLRFNKCRLGDRTIFSGLSVIPPGIVQEYDLDRLGEPRDRVYYKHEFTDEIKTDEEWIGAIIPSLRHAVRTSMHESRESTALSLSGGLDSRALLGALDKQECDRLMLVSCGLPDSSEVVLAAQTAASAGGKYRNVDLGASDFISWARTGVQRNEEFDIFVQGAQGALHKTAAETATTLMTGWDIDVPLRGTYLDHASLRLRNSSDVQLLIESKWSLFSKGELSDLLHDSFYREVGDVPEAWVADLLSLLPSSTPTRLYLQYVFQFEKRRLLMLRNRMIRFELESVLPYYNTRLQMLLAKIPESLKVGNRLFAKLFSRLAPDLAAIPYQRTMLPASVPVEYWCQGVDLENKREALLREIRVKTGISVPYNRYYSNFDEWLQVDHEWDCFVAELLNSKRTLLTQELVKPTAVTSLLETHKSGSKSQMAKLICLMSLELYLREYFS